MDSRWNRDRTRETAHLLPAGDGVGMMSGLRPDNAAQEE